MTDLLSLVANPQFASVILRENNVRPIFVDGRPNKNPKHLKNIVEYCNLFHFLDLDYLTVRTHASGQSTYNPVEHSMAFLSGKLARITLSVDEYSTYLNSQENIIDKELA